MMRTRHTQGKIFHAQSLCSSFLTLRQITHAHGLRSVFLTTRGPLRISVQQVHLWVNNEVSPYQDCTSVRTRYTPEVAIYTSNWRNSRKSAKNVRRTGYLR